MLGTAAAIPETRLKRVLLIDNHPLMLEALRRVTLSVRPKAHTIEVGSFEAIDGACRFGATIDLVIMDPCLTGTTGLSALVTVQQRLPHAPVVVFASRDDDQMISHSNALGAAAYLHKSAGMAELADCLSQVMDGARVFPRLTGSNSAHHDLAAMRKRLEGLTPTQLKVLLNIADGRLNKRVAADFNVSEAAIKAHMTAIFRKLGVQNRTQAMLALQPLLAAGFAAAA